MKTTLRAAVALVLAAAFAVAQPAAQNAPLNMPMGGMMSGTQDMPKMPGMTSEQLSKMDAQRIAHLRAVGPIKTDIAVRQIELAGLWRAENLDARKITAKVNEISALKAKLALAMADNKIAMHRLLTPEQRKSMRSGTHCMLQGMMTPGMMMQDCPMMGGGMMQGCPLMGSGMMGRPGQGESKDD
ncbi:periplasmic heavy metal sensor [candidate division WOR-3 bacterium]|nr:periplasmic heavy metal sensor [candidate division WOR-3 bacterium]